METIAIFGLVLLLNLGANNYTNRSGILVHHISEHLKLRPIYLIEVENGKDIRCHCK